MSYKHIGNLKAEIAEYWGIEEHKNKSIVVYDDRKDHVKESHLQDFGNEEEIEKVYNSLHHIIKNPDYVYYNPDTKGLEYYKKMKNNICVAVRIKAGKTLKVRSWYPANATKITNRKKKELEQKFLKIDE